MVAQGKRTSGARNPGTDANRIHPPRPGLSAVALAKVERAAAERCGALWKSAFIKNVLPYTAIDAIDLIVAKQIR